MVVSPNQYKKGFTLIELLIVIAIIGILASIVLSNLRAARIGAEVVEAIATQRQMHNAAELYYLDMGFYPPDVNRGWDPGFIQALPWNPDEAAGSPPPPPYDVSGENCSHCPANWQDIVAANWNGPYFSEWPRFSPWSGKYDYNYWPAGATRNGCTLLPGIYIGVQGDYDNNNTLSSAAEQRMIAQNIEAELCENGESQLLLWPL